MFNLKCSTWNVRRNVHWNTLAEITSVKWPLQSAGKVEFEACDCDYSHLRILNFIKLQSFKVFEVWILNRLDDDAKLSLPVQRGRSLHTRATRHIKRLWFSKEKFDSSSKFRTVPSIREPLKNGILKEEVTRSECRESTSARHSEAHPESKRLIKI